jgi:hypothetical protein
MSNNENVPGMIYPTQKAMIGSNPQESAMISANNKALMQAQANKLMSGGKIKRKYLGGAIAVPQFQMLYEPQGGVGTNPNSQITANSQVSTQMKSNSYYDKQATQMGGLRRRKSMRKRTKRNFKRGSKKRGRNSRRKY